MTDATINAVAMMDTYKTYLNSFYVKKGDSKSVIITNTRIGDKKRNLSGGSFHIPDDKYDEFLRTYYRAIVQTDETEYLTERQLDSNGPILVDIDLRYDLQVTERIHTKDHVLDLVCLYLDELKTMYQFDNSTPIHVFVFEKDHVNRVEDKKVTKDGIHMIIGLQVERQVQKILRERVLAKIADTWSDIPIQNSWEEAFDEGITKGHTNWQLYGSCKPQNEKYRLKYVYEISLDEADDELTFNPLKLSVFETEDAFLKLSIRYKNHPSLFMTTKFADEMKSVSASSASSSSSSSTAMTNRVVSHTNLQATNTDQDVFQIRSHEELTRAVQYFLETLEPPEYELREAYEYTMILPKTYYDEGSFPKWIRVGWALRNISPRLFIVWVAFSAQSSSFSFRSIRDDLWERWRSFESNTEVGLTKRSIMYWVKQECPDEFKKVHHSSIDYFVDQTLERLYVNSGGEKRGSGDFDIAMVLYHLFKDDYVCVSVKGNIWYRFKNHKWTEIDSGTTLRRAISEELRDVYTRKVNRIHRQMTQLDPEDERAKVLKKKAEIVISICDRLSRTNDKKNIMIEAKELFYDPQFLEKLDTNPYLLCFNNGVVDFKTRSFRKGNPEDYLSLSTNIDYYQKLEKRVVDELEDFMHKLFPCDELYKYMWDHLSSCLLGTCDAQTINMYIGIGQNGKSVLVNLMEQVLGDYKGDVPLTLLTQQRTKIGGLAPELVQLKGRRYAVIQEPSKGDKINEGVMKQLTGGDPIQARAPYMPQIMTYTPQFKLVVCSNEFMEIKSQDHGTWRRIRVVDFMSLFTENPRHDDPEKPYQYKLDKSIKEKFAYWKETFAAMLVQRAFDTQGRVDDCDMVLASSNEYRIRQDFIAEFISDRICRDAGRCVQKAELADQFREWHTTNCGGKLPNIKDVVFYMERAFGKCRDGVWVGLKFKSRHNISSEVSVTSGGSNHSDAGDHEEEELVEDVDLDNI
jgi:P4 family phage/plasmid primase-like protien